MSEHRNPHSDYRPPVLTCFGRIADLTAGGSGPVVESGMTVGMGMVVGSCAPTEAVDTASNNNCIP